MYKIFSVSILLFLLGIPQTAGAQPSVGSGTGVINLPAPVQKGTVVELPPMTVYNDGTSAGSFFMELTLNEKQDQLKPDSKWIKFTPGRFELGPGEAQLVRIEMNLPDSASAGEYFGYIESGVKAVNPDGTTSIKGSSAAKLTFSVAGQKPTRSDTDFSSITRSTSLPIMISDRNR